MTKAPIPKKANKSAYPSNLATERAIAPADNMQSKPVKDMSFKVDAEFHTKYKILAVTAGLSMKELLEQSLDAWQEKNLKS